MALSQGLLDTYWRRYNQRRALTGLPSSYQEMRGTLDPMLEYGLRESQRQAEVDRQNKQLDMQKQAQNDAARAATVSGVASTVGMLGSGALTYKSLGNQAANNKLLASYMSTPSTAPATSAGVGSGGTGILSGAGSGASAGATEAGSMAAYDASLAAGAAEGVGSTAGTAATTGSASAMGGVGVAGPAALAALAGIYGPGLLKKTTGMNDTWSKGLVRGPESFLGSAAEHVAGKTAGLIVDPVGHLGDFFASEVFGW